MALRFLPEELVLVVFDEDEVVLRVLPDVLVLVILDEVDVVWCISPGEWEGSVLWTMS